MRAGLTSCLPFVLVALALSACDPPAEQVYLPVDRELPATLAGAIGDAQRALAADFAFELEEREPIRAFAWTDGRGNYDVVFYRRRGEAWERYGGLVGPTGFDPPRVEGTPPRLCMRDRNLGIDFVFTFDESGPVFAPRAP